MLVSFISGQYPIQQCWFTRGRCRKLSRTTTVLETFLKIISTCFSSWDAYQSEDHDTLLLWHFGYYCLVFSNLVQLIFDASNELIYSMRQFWLHLIIICVSQLLRLYKSLSEEWRRKVARMMSWIETGKAYKKKKSLSIIPLTTKPDTRFILINGNSAAFSWVLEDR